MTAGFKWTEGGVEKTHELGYPFKLESAPALERSRYSATPVDKSAAPTVLEVGSAVEIATARIRFDRFPRRLLRLLDRGASLTEIDYYPDLARETFFPLLMRDMGNLQAIEPDADRFGGGEYERRLEVRSRDGTPIWPLYGTVEFNGTGEENLLRDAEMDTSITDLSHLSLPGTSGNYASTPDATALDITGDIDLRAAVALDDWADGTRQTLFDKRSGSTGYILRISASGIIELLHGNGSSLPTLQSTTAISAANSSLLLVRATLDVDNGTSNADATFYTKESRPSDAPSDLVDSSGWTQLGNVVQLGSTTSINTNTQDLEVGARGGGSLDLLAGKVYAAAIWDGIDGTVVFDADFTDHSAGTLTFTEDSANAATVTINQSGDPKAEIVENFSSFPLRTNTAGAVDTIDGAAGARKLEIVDAASGTSTVMGQDVLKVSAGDELTASADVRIDTLVDATVKVGVRWMDDTGTELQTDHVSLTATQAFARSEVTATAPSGTVKAQLECLVEITAANGDATVLFRDARLLRAGSDPTTYANPHVDGAGQVGDSLATAGWPANRQNIIRAGDILRAGGSGTGTNQPDDLTPFLRATADVDADANGEATIPLEFDIGADDAPADGAALRLVHPMFD